MILPKQLALLFYVCGMISLMLSFTNFVPLSLAFVPLAGIAMFGYRNRTQLICVVCTAIMLGYFATSAIIYCPSQVVNVQFFRRDGNVFVAFAPVMVFGVIALRMPVEKFVRGFLDIVTIIDLACIAIYLAAGRSGMLGEDGIYHFLFVAHNAAGGFLATVLAYAIGEFHLGRRTIRSLCWLLINGAGLVLTRSNGSVLGLAMAVLIVIVLQERHIRLLLALYLLLLIALLRVTYPIWMSLGSPEDLERGVLQNSSVVSLYGEGRYDNGNLMARVVVLWPRAVWLWFHSPLVGTGFGSYNDIAYGHFRGVVGWVAFVDPVSIVDSDSHAHHSFLHILAETGVVGLGLVVLTLCSYWNFLRGISPPALREGLLLAFWTAIWSSMTEHRLTTPSQMLPFTLCLGFSLANYRAEYVWSRVRKPRATEGSPKKTVTPMQEGEMSLAKPVL